MRTKKIGLILASVGLVAGLTGVMAGTASASKKPKPPAIKLSGGKKPCSVKGDKVTNGCSIKVVGSNWVAADGAVGVTECNPSALTGDSNACDDDIAVIVQPSGKGKWTIKDFKVETGTVGDGTCGGSVTTCYIGGGDIATEGAAENVSQPFTFAAGQ
jgi:hypothetical protein